MSACRASAASRGCAPLRARRGTDGAGPTSGEAGGFSCRRRRTPVNRNERSNPPLRMAELFNLIAGVDRLNQARILCVGDVLLDHYVYGQVKRRAPAAPLPTPAR